MWVPGRALRVGFANLLRLKQLPPEVEGKDLRLQAIATTVLMYPSVAILLQTLQVLLLPLSLDAQIFHSGPTSPLSSPLRAPDLGPTLTSLPHLMAVGSHRQQMLSWSKVLSDRAICSEKALGMTR